MKSGMKQKELYMWIQLLNQLPLVFLILQFTHIFGVVSI